MSCPANISTWQWNTTMNHDQEDLSSKSDFVNDLVLPSRLTKPGEIDFDCLLSTLSFEYQSDFFNLITFEM